MVGARIACAAAGMARIGGGLWIGSALIAYVAPGMERIDGALRFVGAVIASARGRNVIVSAVIASVGVDPDENWSLTPFLRARIRDGGGFDALGAVGGIADSAWLRRRRVADQRVWRLVRELAAPSFTRAVRHSRCSALAQLSAPP